MTLLDFRQFDGCVFSGQVALRPIINECQVARIQAIVSDAVAAGATLAAGGSHSVLTSCRTRSRRGSYRDARSEQEPRSGPSRITPTYGRTIFERTES